MIQIRFLRFRPIEYHPEIIRLNKSAQRLLISVYHQQAATTPAAFDRLLELAQYRMKEIALAASADLDQAVVHSTPSKLFPLLRSISPGVRANALMAIIQVSNQYQTLTSKDLTECCQILSQENNQAVARLLCNLVTIWVRQHQELPDAVFDALAVIPPRLLERNLFEGGIARALMDALKAIAQSEAPTLDAIALSQLVRLLLNSIHLIQVRNSESEMIDLICAVNRLNPTFLVELVHSDCSSLAHQGWNRNIYAIIRSIRRIEGQQSPLLHEILVHEWCTDDLKSIILEVRGA